MTDDAKRHLLPAVLRWLPSDWHVVDVLGESEWHEHFGIGDPTSLTIDLMHQGGARVRLRIDPTFDQSGVEWLQRFLAVAAATARGVRVELG